MKPLLIQLREAQLFYFCDQIDVMGVIDDDDGSLPRLDAYLA